ncbi:DUF2971 domain-containing protein [Anaerosinus massiliensis]|uniref:DUF2971 domain-containing protein n=1 Tax=Massilibacillus massiliensis TaxID=1806837 RepID=UPI000DA6058D|nr:DUF2971 domain-containing protein [Massilibacillus massiliensis]
MFSKIVTDQYLYHYTTLEIAIEKILYSGKIRFGPFEETNDPRESQDWRIVDALHLRLKKSGADLISSVNEERLKRCKVLCLTQDDRSNCQSGFGCRGFARARMWAQYAGNHRGVCLIFDAKKLDQEIDRALSGKGKVYRGVVTYTNSFHDVREAATFKAEELTKDRMKYIVQKHIDKYANTIFFHKNRDWRDETEYRYVFYSDDIEYQFISLDKILKGIVLGIDFPNVYDPVIGHFKEKYDLEVRYIGWDKGIPYIQPLNKDK